MKKYLLLIVLSVFCAMMLIGCGKSDEVDGQEEQTGQTEQTEQNAQEPSLDHKVGSKVPEGFLSSEELANLKAVNFTYNENNLDYRLVWSDEFDYEGKPDENKWSYGSGDSAKVENGKLIIELRKEQADDSSVGIVTRGKSEWTYGKIEIAAKLPAGQGIQSVIKMVPSENEYGEWPSSGEIDVMEQAGYDRGMISASIHTESYNDDENARMTNSVQVEDCSEEFHVYAVEWLPDKMIFTVDGEEYFTYKPTDHVERPTYTEWPFDTDMYLMLDAAVGENQNGQSETDETIEAAQMEVDYVRVYQSPYINYIERTDKEVDDPLLKADGKVLRNGSGDGDVVQLRGTNAGGYLFQEPWMTTTRDTDRIKAEEDIYAVLTERFGEEEAMELIALYQDNYWTESDFDYCQQIGLNCIRLPFWYRNFVDENGKFYDNCWERLDWFLEQAEAREVYVILDFHGAPGSQNGSDHSGRDGGDEKLQASEFFFGEQETVEKNQELFYEIWEAVAKHCKDNPWVAGYDLLNEPYCTYRYNSGYDVNVLHQMLWDVYDTAYQRIRSIDPNHVIIMEAVWEPTDLPDPDTYGWENIMYEYHHYPNGNAAVDDMRKVLKTIIEANYNVPSYMGEFTLYDSLETWDEGLDVINASGISWTTWTYKVSFQGNWGIRNQHNWELNLETYDYEAIVNIWSQVGSSTANEGLAEVLSKYYSMVYLGAE